MTILPFQPLPPLLGGLLIGTAGALLLYLNGRILGISGIYGGLIKPSNRTEVPWRAAMVLGMMCGGFILRLWFPEVFDVPLPVRQPFWLVSAGLLVGLGTAISSGCTSGHGICGISRLSPRSLVATGTFMALGMFTVFVIRHLLSRMS